MAVLDDTLTVLDRCLALGGRARHFGVDTRLLGSLPELDSMAVVGVITGLEDHFGIAINDDEISADTFETVGSLAQFVEHKLAPSAG